MSEHISDTRCGHISPEEANEIITRFCHSHFRKDEKARFSIPIDFKRDDDVRLGAFVMQYKELQSSLEASKKREEELREALKWIRTHELLNHSSPKGLTTIVYDIADSVLTSTEVSK